MTNTQTAPAASSVRNIVFIDSSVTDLQLLMAALKPGTQVELIDTLEDGVAQIAAVLRQYSELDSVQIVSHGSEGQIRLGSTVLDGDNLAAYQAQLQDWGRALSEDGDLLLYGCDVAAGDAGQAFIDALAQTTQADVAASTDTTGSTLRGANWTLERSTGTIEAASALSAEAQAAYAHTLALVNNGSAGTITFNTSSDVTLLNATGLAPGAVVHADNILSTGLDVYAQSTAGGSITVTNANGTSVLGVPLTDDRLTVNGSLLSPVSHVDLRANSGVFDLLSLKLGSGNLVGNLLGTTVFTVYALDANYQPTGVGVSLTGLVVNEYGLLNFASMANFKGIFGVRIVNPLGFEVGIDDIQVANGKAAPSIASASYNAGSGVLSITAAGISAGDTIDPGKLTLSGEGGSYTLTSPAVTASSGTSIVITLNAADKLALNGVLNNNGGTAVGGATFNLAAALNWDGSRPSGPDLSGNPVTVSNVQLPTISSASYDATTHVLTVTGSNLVALVGASNDITVSKLTLRGDGGASYTLATTGNVEVTSASSFSVTLSGADIAAVGALLNKNGVASAGGMAYALSAGDDWNSVIGNTSIAVGGVGVVVSNVSNSAPTITGTATASIGDNATVQPFANVTVADADGGSLSLSISYNAANGSLSGAGLTGSAGSYSLSAATPAALTGLLKALTFTPTANQAVVGAQVNTTFSLTATDSQGLSSPANAATVVTATSINDASVIGGTVAAQAVAAGGTVRPFSGVTVSDPDVGTSVTVTIGISQNGGTHGIFTPASASAAGFVSHDGGLTYTLGPSAPGAAQAALQSLVFQAVAGQGGTTTFSLSINDGSATVTNTTTSVVATVPSSTTALTVAFSSDTGISATDLITQTAAQTISGTLSGGLASGEAVQVSLDNGASWTNATAQVGASTWTLAGQTLTGAGILQVRVTNAGGSSTPLSASYALDTTPPGTLGHSVQFSSDTGDSNADLITSVAQQDISGTLNAVLASDEHVEVSLDNGGHWVTASSGTGSANWTLANQTLTGSNTLQVRVVDAAGNAGTAFSAPYALDTTAPTVALSSNASTLKSGETALITLAFSEAPYGLSLSDLSAVGGTLDHLVATANPRIFTVEFSPNAGQSGVLGSVSLTASSYTDIVGNDGAGGSTGAITINTLGPSLQISSDMAALRTGQTALITFTFSSPPTDFAEGDIVVTGGTLGGFASQGAGIYTAVFTPGANVSEAASITVASGSYTDAFGNPGGSGVTPLLQVDTVAPTLLITSDVPALKAGETATITFTFSEAPSGFTDADVVVGNGTLGPLAATANPLVYTAVFTPQANVSGGAASITVAQGSYADPAGNGGGAGASPSIAIHTQGTFTTGFGVTFSADTGANPSDLITRTAAQDISGTLTNPLASGETVQVSLDNGVNWIPANAAEGSDAWSLAGRTLTQSDVLQVRVQDAFGNYGPVFSAPYVLDTTAPSVQVASDLSSLRAGETATLTFTFSEVPDQFGAASLDVSGGTIGNVAATANPLVYTATFTPTPGQSGGTATVQVKAGGYSDNAGNGGQASASTSISINTAQPGLAITSDANVLGIGATTQLTFTFSSAPTGFTAGDISVNNGTLSDFAATTNPLVYTAQFTPTPGLASAQATVAVAAGAYTDAFGNSSAGAASQPITIDTLAPSVLISSSVSALKAGETAMITFSFSEIPLGFNAASVHSNGGTLSGLAVTADPLVFTALFTPTAGIQNIAAGFSFAPGAVADAAGNALATPTVAPLIIDTLAPVTQANTVVFSNDDGISTDDLVTRTSAQDISGTLASALGVDEHVEVSLNNGTSWAVATASGTAWSLPNQTLAGSNTLQVRVVDAAGNQGPVHSAAYVLDTTGPSVAITSSGGPLKAGDTATITFTFSEAVAGFSLSGVAAGSGTLSDLVQTGNPLVYTALYTPNPGVDGVQDSISVTGGSYTDRAGNAGSGGLSAGITVDTQAPTATAVNVVFSGDSNLPDRITNVAVQTLSGTLSATPQAGEVVQVSLDQGNTWASATSTGPNSWSLPGQILSPGAGQQVQVRVSDAAGNHGAVTSFGYTLDQSPPSVQITSEKPSLNSADTPVITFRFSEAPLGFSAASLDVTGGLLSGFTATADPLVYQAVFTPTPGQPSGTGTVMVLPGTYTDLAGNSGLGAPALYMPYNTVSPGVSIHSNLAVLKAGDVANITFQFSSAPQGFAPEDLVVSGGTLSGLTATSDPLVYTAQFTPTPGTAQGTAQVSIASGLFTDINGNPGVGGSLPTVRIDTLAPQLTITSDTEQLNANGTALITFTFSEEPAFFTLGNISATNGTLSDLIKTGNPLVYTAVFTPTAQLSGASAQISVAQNAYADLAGNGGGGSAGPVIHLQTQGPQLTSSGVRFSDDTGISDTDLITRTAQQDITGTLAGGTLVAGDVVQVSWDNGQNWVNASSAVGSASWTLAGQNLADHSLNGSGSLKVRVVDGAGNLGAVATHAFTLDTTAPTVTITSDAANLRAGESALIRLTFSEAPQDFTDQDLAATGGTLSGFTATANPLVYTVVLTPTPGATGQAHVMLANGLYSDTAGNDGGGGSSPNIAIDTLVPALAITSNAAALKAGQSATVTFRFDKPPVGFTLGSVTVTDGTLSDFAATTNPLVYTATFTPTPGLASGNAQVSVAPGAYTDGAGNPGTGASSTPMAIDTLAPTTTGASVSFSDDNGTSGMDLLTNVAQQTVSGTVDAPLQAGEHVEVSLDNGATWTPAQSTGPVQWQLDLQLLDNGPPLQVRVADAAGNTGPVFSAAYVLDRVAPTVHITSSASSLRAGESATLTFTFSEVPSGFDDSALTATHGTLSAFTPTADPRVYTVVLTPVAGQAGSSASVSVAPDRYTDAAGNPGGAASSPPILLNTALPVLQITSDTSVLRLGQQAAIEFRFSQLPLGFGMEDITVTGGVLSGFGQTADPRVYTAILTPTPGVANGSATIDVNGGYSDSAGNPGGVSAMAPIAYSTLGPSTGAASVSFSTDTGASGTDLVTSHAQQLISGTLDASLLAGETVQISLDNGQTWLAATAVPGEDTWVMPSQLQLSGSGMLQVRVTGITGNPGPVWWTNYAIDTTATTIAITSDVATLKDGESATVTFTFSEPPQGFTTAGLTITGGSIGALVATSDPKVYTVVFTPTPGYNGAVGITLAPGSYADAAGNAGLGGALAGLIVDNTPPTTPGEPTNPTNPTQTIDGVQVSTRPGDGSSTITDIPIVTPSRTEDPTTPNTGLADIPIVRGTGGHAILEVSVPVGLGLQAQGVLSGLAGNAAIEELLLRMERAGGTSDQIALGRMFEETLNPSAPLYIQTLTLASGPGYDPQVPFVVRGSPLAGDGEQAIILDARTLPPGSVIQVDNVSFVAVMGNVRMIGSQGQYFVTADNEDQWIVVGTGQDVVHGGGGNDTVGSLDGDDQVFGDAGNDVVFGGSGNDTLSGGTGNDRLDGGLGWDTALQSGSLSDYTLRTDGQFLVMTHKTTGEVDILKSIETVKFDTGANLYIADSDAEAALAHIITRWLGRELTAAEGTWAQQNSGLTDLQVAQVLLSASYAAPLLGHTAQELVAGWQSNPQIVRMDVPSEHLQGTDGLDQVGMGMRQADLHLQRTGTDRWEGTSLINGDMAEFIRIERLHLEDVSVALDTQGTAGKAAALLSVTLGTQGLQHKGLAGAALAALDAGMSLQDLGDVAMGFAQAQQGRPFTAQETVQWLWTKAIGSAGTEQQLQPLVQQLQSGQISTGDLVNAAVQHALAHPSAQLVGVLDGGLLYNA